MNSKFEFCVSGFLFNLDFDILHSCVKWTFVKVWIVIKIIMEIFYESRQ